jgi:hypothetical protein
MLNELSLEQLAIILFYLGSFELTKYVTVSRLWQYAIERRTFLKIQLKSTDLLAFSNIFVENRRAGLTELSYSVILPTYSDYQCARFEREKDK